MINVVIWEMDSGPDRSDKGLMLTKARFKLVVEFHLSEWKLSGCFGL